MKKRIIFHGGSAKTGSTTLQAYLWQNRELLAENGVFYCPRFMRAKNVDALNEAIRNIRTTKRPDRAVAMGRKRLEELFEMDGHHTVIVSNESALGEPFVEGKSGFFPDAGLTLKYLAQMFAGYDVTAIFFVRNQATLLPSFYGQRIRQGASDTLQEFTERSVSGGLSWQALVQDLRTVFSSTAVHTFEDFAQNPAIYTAQIFDPLLRIEGIDYSRTIRKNRAPKSRAIASMRAVNRHLDKKKFKSEYEKSRFRKKIRGTLFGAIELVMGGEKPTLTDERTEELATLYSEDLAVLFKV
ncbi:MAG: hypothetical protein JKY60_05235 [Kordiimonadaceae bacterium]|nr:hypothetical protein [Kordiimonadaceae bacterium]